MSKQSFTVAVDGMNPGTPQEYAPSWVDLVTAWVGRLPGTSWAYYLGLGLVLFSIQTIVAWVEGAFPVGTFLRVQGFMAAAMAFFLAQFGFLGERAGKAMDSLGPALDVSEDDYPGLRYELTTLPRYRTLLASVVTVLLAFLPELYTGPFYFAELETFPISSTIFRIIYFVLWWIFGAFLYQVVRRLRLINRIYTQHTQVNLFLIRPLYAFSNLAALTAGSLTVVLYGWLSVNPTISLRDPATLGWVVLVITLAIASFLWPQLGIHRLQVDEKDRLLDEANQRLLSLIDELHRRVDEGKLEEMGDLNTAIASLEMELNLIKGTATWPWEPEVVRLLITAVALPLGLWLIQVILESRLGA